jgi:hypothetical protein
MIDAVRPSASRRPRTRPLLGLQPQQREDRAAQVVGGRAKSSSLGKDSNSVTAAL